jgi:hypothetical protein
MPKPVCLTAVLLALACQLVTPATATPAAVDREEIHRLLGLQRKAGKLVNDCGNTVTPQINIVDLNGDGQPEVFALVNDSICYGAAGGQLSLFIKTASGGWKDHFGFPAGGYRLLARRRSGYRDVEIDLPGMCLPIWGWSGQGYAIVKRCKR